MVKKKEEWTKLLAEGLKALFQNNNFMSKTAF